MNFRYLLKGLFASAFFLLYSTLLVAQNTIVSGKVIDASDKQPLPFVSVGFPGTTVGVTTDSDGKFTLNTSRQVTQIKISFVGYKEVVLNISPGKTQTLNTVSLQPISEQLTEVEIRSGKKVRYRNRDNPAVELIRRVIANKEKNRPERYNYVEYREYDKLQFALSNLPPSLTERKLLRKYAFLLNNKDSVTVPGKALTPIFLDEKLSQYYYRRNPEAERTVLLGEKKTDLGSFIDSDGINDYIKNLYAKVDVYDNNIFLVTKNFLSPISDNSPNFYKFFITDTITTADNSKLVELSFTPRNTEDILFEGKIYVTIDSNYAVQRVKLGINKNINVNYLTSMNINQDFEKNTDGRYRLVKSNTLAEFKVGKKRNGGFFGIRTITYGDYLINHPRPDTAYTGEKQTDEEIEALQKQPIEFWKQNRLDTLTTAESKVYTNIDSLTNMPSFKRTMDIATLVLAGYKSFGKFEIGPANTFYSFNPVEGLKLRLGGRTTPELSKRYYFETYAAYGFKDEKWKYFISATYSLNNKSIYKFPQNYVRFSFNRDTRVPGAQLQFVQRDNIFLSFTRGTNDKYLYNDLYRFDYVREFENHFSYSFTFRNLKQTPAGSLYYQNNTGRIQDLTTSDATLMFRYAPNEKFYQGKIYRIPIPNKYPIFTVDYTMGINKLFGGQYGYHNLHARVDKRVYLSQLGWADVFVEGGRMFSKVPYPLLNIFRANQSFNYDIYSYNLMNFLEFVSDKYVSVNIDQHFQGFFFNKVPLLKKLKWREVASFKAIKGGLTDQNNPAINGSLFQFPVTSTGAPITYALGNEPYMEGSVGIENIFKLLRVDLVRRFSYLDHPQVAQYGIRARVKFEF
ncbi:DUF5686 and carboxypeptidase-like regulatory domain-containing protein [Mucilaginibacter auburnensis]|uniref:Carboxypeptidase-like protein n=1 Tax=Mucilaginibacter auburnensis TaxID=1457233 RepID=A0A2H9VV91_9SPHI|nr:DUF5686 and carboxypeptidase-like regulatory domain-containing protein [Mucilaginibacter auburnensis]PJJ84738.1 carboxypeptidase-like protein [Mucilaginibacter auburnensis]